MQVQIGKINKSNADDEFDDDDINLRDISRGIDLDEESGDDENKKRKRLFEQKSENLNTKNIKQTRIIKINRNNNDDSAENLTKP
jgi:hypothetical protein